MQGSARPTSDAGKPWHTRPASDIADQLKVVPAAGLDVSEAERRLASYGPNVLPQGRSRGALRMFVSQFTDVMVLVLLGAAVVSGLVGDLKDTIAILAIVLLSAVLGFVQEFRAQRAVAALRALAAPSARVRRDEQVATIPATELVAGDVVLLEAGNVVPADIRLFEAVRLRVDEAALTGESQPVEKATKPLDDATLPTGERVNMAYKGTVVTYGRGAGLVVGTGVATELGRIASLLKEGEDRTPLQKRLARFGRHLAVVVLVLCGVIFALGIARGEDAVLMLLTAMSLAVAAIPEALPAVVTVSLALGARKMVRQNALVRRLPAVETLGSVTYICTDKTGTLTQNRMQVGAFYVGGRRVAEPPPAESHTQPWTVLLEALALSNDALIGESGEPQGDPTEVALLRAAADAGYARAGLDKNLPRIAELPFSSERARMTTLHRRDGEVIAFTKGAPERVLPGCVDALSASGSGPLDRREVLRVADELASTGHRVLALAFRRLSDGMPDLSASEAGQTFLGLVGLLDPPRPEARDAVHECRSAGIHVVMITGDHPTTARAIAARMDIAADAPGGSDVMTGPELERLPLGELEERIEQLRVYARVAPEQKIKIVQALQDRGEFVAMTGDGVNDAPALASADIGVAMGRGGTDVAREAADLVLLDDNFATIVAAVREGRRIYDNVRKFVKYTLTSNAGEIWVILLAPFLGLPLPLLPIHILWINLVTDGLPGIALTAEPEEAGLMARPPRHPQESIFAHGLWQHAIWVGLLMGGVTLATQAWAYHTGFADWQTMTFTVLTLSQLGHVLAVRSERASLFRQGLRSNLPLTGAVVLTFALQLMTLYLPALNAIFRTQPLPADALAIAIALSSVVFLAVEVEKTLVRKGWLYRERPVATMSAHQD